MYDKGFLEIQVEYFVKHTLEFIKRLDNPVYNDLASDWIGKELKERIYDNTDFANEVKYVHKFSGISMYVDFMFHDSTIDVMIHWEDKDKKVDGIPFEMNFRKMIELKMI